MSTPARAWRPSAALIVFAVAVAVAGGLAFLAWQSQRPAAGAQGELTASGTVEARIVDLAAETGGRVAQVLADEGERVSAGQMLVRLDDAATQAQLAQARASLQAAQANYDLLVAGPTAEQTRQAEAALEMATASYSRTVSGSRDIEVDAARAAVAAAEAAYAKVLGGATAEDLAVADAGLNSAAAALQQAQYAYDNAFRRNPAGIGATPASLNLEQATHAYAAARAQYDKVAKGADLAQVSAAWQQVVGARAALERVSRPARDFDIAFARAQVRQAQAQLDALKAGARQQQLDAARAQIALAQAQVQGIEVQLKKTILLSPVDGIVLNRSIEPGEMASPGAALFGVGRLEALELTVYLSEDRFALVKPGQAAIVRVDAYPGRDFPATVLRIADKAEFTPRNVQTVDGRKETVYAVRLSIPNADLSLKSGMPADVRFVRN